jgi:hypothetical protein
MRVESGGHEYINGQLTVSSAGAMGLMQLEPETYNEMANENGLGSDPFNPYDNIMAGAAYIHAMYQIYGSPGFLAAYDAGPGRLNSYMNGVTNTLPNETVNYVAMIAPHIQGYYPVHRSEADQLALNTQPITEAPGILPPGFVPEAVPIEQDAPAAVEVASNEPPPLPEPMAPAPAVQAPAEMAPMVQEATPAGLSSQSTSVLAAAVSSLPTPPPAPPESLPSQPSIMAAALVIPQPSPLPFPPAPRRRHGFSVIPEAMADTLPEPPPPPSLPSYMVASPHHHSGWAIQVGAYDSSSNARAALGIAELSAVQMLMGAHPMVVSIHAEGHVKYRARFVGLERDDALHACSRLSGGPTGCKVLSPEEQS